MALILLILAIVFIVIYFFSEKKDGFSIVASGVCLAITLVLLFIANRLPRNISISITDIPIDNTDSFFVTYDTTNDYVCFEDGYDNYYVIPREKAIIETFSANKSNAISVKLVTVTNKRSAPRDILSDLGAFDFSSNRNSEYYYFFIPESAQKLQEATEPNE